MKRLLELRKEKSLSQRAIAKILNVSQTAYYTWETGKCQPSIEQLVMIADFFEVTVDFLIGRTDDGIAQTPRDGAFSAYLNLSKDDQETVRALIQRLQK